MKPSLVLDKTRQLIGTVAQQEKFGFASQVGRPHESVKMQTDRHVCQGEGWGRGSNSRERKLLVVLLHGGVFVISFHLLFSGFQIWEAGTLSSGTHLIISPPNIFSFIYWTLFIRVYSFLSEHAWGYSCYSPDSCGSTSARILQLWDNRNKHAETSLWHLFEEIQQISLSFSPGLN